MTDNVKPIDPFQKNDFRTDVEKMKRHLGDFIEYNKMVTHIRKEAYEEYIKQGFTPNQALELCKEHIKS